MMLLNIGFGLTEYSILAIYLLLSAGIGLYFARSQKNIEGYYLAERSAPWWAVGISIISSDLTAVSYIGCAALVFTGDLQYSLAAFISPVAALVVACVFIPFMAKMHLFTIYEYLEHRFNLGVRTVASVFFMLQRGGHLSVAMYAASLALAQILGVNVVVSLIILGGVTTLYTVFGGMKAVLWTDVAQFFVLISGLVAILVAVAIAFHWDISQIWNIAAHPPQTPMPWLQEGQTPIETHTRFFNFDLNPTVEMTFWAILVGVFVSLVGAYGSDQVLVQRYLSAGSKKQMVKSLLFGSLLNIPVSCLLYCTGIGFVAYYHYFMNKPDHEWISTLADPNRVLPHFVGNALPGILGALVIAGLFAGTMSSFASGLNSLSTATYIDLIKRFGKHKNTNEHMSVVVAKLVTTVWGMAIIVAAIYLGGKDSIFKLLAKVMGLFAGPLVGMFFLGMLSSRTNNFGVIAGAIVGMIATACAANFTNISWLYYAPLGCVVTMVIGYLASFLRPAPDYNKIKYFVVGGGSIITEKPEIAEVVK